MQGQAKRSGSVSSQDTEGHGKLQDINTDASLTDNKYVALDATSPQQQVQHMSGVSASSVASSKSSAVNLSGTGLLGHPKLVSVVEKVLGTKVGLF